RSRAAPCRRDITVSDSPGIFELMTVFVHCSVGFFLCQVTRSVTSTWGGRQALRRPVNSNGFIGPLQLALAFSTV
ncbi:hypothetical protein M9458_030382, partial [Cirrhinus mrigala]